MEHEKRWYQEEAVDILFDYCLKPHLLDSQGKPIPRNPLICLPTGTGKSHVIAEFLKRAFEYIPTTRAIMATHVKELILQNAEKLQEAWPLAPLGFYSAGVGKAETVQPIIFGGIQSLVGKYPKFGYRDFLIVDEAHLIGDDGSYLKFINELQMINPRLFVIGLSATPYRMGLGSLTNGKIFTDIVYNLCNIDGFNRLFAEGYLCPLIPKRGIVEFDVSNVGISKGDYNQTELNAAISKQRQTTLSALQEFVAYGVDRKCWCIFASGIEHAEFISDTLNDLYGVSTVVIHSKRTDAQNTEAMKLWKSGQVRCAVNMNSLTTGVDNPMLDYIGCFRSTMSTGLWVQMLGRGTRVWFNKLNCLAMDYAGNTRRLGPINDPVVPRLKGQGAPGDAPVRICPACGVYNHARAVVCIACATVFPVNEKINKYASTEELIRSDQPQVEMFDVARVVYSKHVSKATGNQSIKASYFCGLHTYYEWVTVEGKGFASKRGRDWFRQRYPSEPPPTNDEVLQLTSMLRAPARIRVWINKKFPEVLGAEF